MISIIAAIGENRELGKNNALLWDIPEDMQHFRAKTKGHAVIMGRKTYESIGHMLPDRPNIVVTKDKAWQPIEPVLIAHSLEDAIAVAKTKEREEIYIIGGASIYEQAVTIADKLYLTIVHRTFPDADTYFPKYERFTKLLNQKEGSGNGYTYTFFEYGT